MLNENNFFPEQTEEEKENIEKNRRFYVAKRATHKFPDLPSEDGIDEQKKVYSISREMPDRYKDKDLKTPEFERDINEAKEWIIKFCEQIGFSEEEIKNRLTENDDIYILSKKIFNKMIEDKHLDGLNSLNEVFVNNSTTSGTSNENCSHLIVLHELIHSICINKIFLTKYFNNSKVISSGYKINKDKKLKAFNEGLTETTTQQILLENNISSPGIAYIDEVIFITELAKDIAKKTETSSREVLAHFQKGMIKGENKYLKIIIDIYGQEAFNNLINMKCGTEDVIKVSKSFNLQVVEEKIDDFRNNQNKITINIGDDNYDIKSIKPEEKKGIMERFKKKFGFSVL